MTKKTKFSLPDQPVKQQKPQFFVNCDKGHGSDFLGYLLNRHFFNFLQFLEIKAKNMYILLLNIHIVNYKMEIIFQIK